MKVRRSFANPKLTFNLNSDEKRNSLKRSLTLEKRNKSKKNQKSKLDKTENANLYAVTLNQTALNDLCNDMTSFIEFEGDIKEEKNPENLTRELDQINDVIANPYSSKSDSIKGGSESRSGDTQKGKKRDYLNFTVTKIEQGREDDEDVKRLKQLILIMEMTILHYRRVNMSKFFHKDSNRKKILGKRKKQNSLYKDFYNVSEVYKSQFGSSKESPDYPYYQDFN